MDEEEFNQGLILPPLIVQLKKILDQYPDELQIIKVHISQADSNILNPKLFRFCFKF